MGLTQLTIMSNNIRTIITNLNSYLSSLNPNTFYFNCYFTLYKISLVVTILYFTTILMLYCISVLETFIVDTNDIAEKPIPIKNQLTRGEMEKRHRANVKAKKQKQINEKVEKEIVRQIKHKLIKKAKQAQRNEIREQLREKETEIIMPEIKNSDISKRKINKEPNKSFPPIWYESDTEETQ